MKILSRIIIGLLIFSSYANAADNKDVNNAIDLYEKIKQKEIEAEQAKDIDEKIATAKTLAEEMELSNYTTMANGHKVYVRGEDQVCFLDWPLKRPITKLFSDSPYFLNCRTITNRSYTSSSNMAQQYRELIEQERKLEKTLKLYKRTVEAKTLAKERGFSDFTISTKNREVYVTTDNQVCALDRTEHLGPFIDGFWNSYFLNCRSINVNEIQDKCDLCGCC